MPYHESLRIKLLKFAARDAFGQAQRESNKNRGFLFGELIMKRCFVIWAVLVSACSVYLFSYRHELGLYWRQWASFQRHLICNDKGHMQLRRPFLSQSIAQQDPEAAAIANFIYEDFDGRDGAAFGDVENLSKLAIQYPDNPYFLYHLACRIASRAYTNPQIINILADRLIEIDPNNGRYYFLKAWAAFYDWDDNRVEKAMEYLEKCFSSPDTSEPYKRYMARVCRLVEQEHPFVSISNMASIGWTDDSNLFRALKEDLMNYTQDLIVNSQSDKAMQIHDRLERLAENNVPYILDDPWCFYLSWDANRLQHRTPQFVELKWMKPDLQRAQQNRRQILAWKRLSDYLTLQRENTKTGSGAIYDHTIPIAAHCFQMAMASLAVMFILGTVGVCRTMQQSLLSLWSLIGVLVLLSIYFFLCRWGDYLSIHSGCGHSHYTFDFTLASWWILSLLYLCKSFWIYGLIVSGLLGCLLAFVFWKKHKTPNLFWRIVIRAVCIVFIISLWLSLSRMQFGTLLWDILFLTITIPLFCFRKCDGKTKGYLNLFSRTPEGMQFRCRCLAMSGIVVLIHLVSFTFFVPSLAKCTVRAVQDAQIIWKTSHPPRFAIDPNDYSFLLSRFETETPWNFTLSEWLPMVDPEDIPGVLTTLKERLEKTRDSQPFPDMLGFDPNNWSDLARAMEYCGVDTLPYIVSFVKEPNSIKMLIVRGRAGDISVNRRLVELWKKDRDAGFAAEKQMRGCLPVPNAGAETVSIPLEAMVRIIPYKEISDYILQYSKEFQEQFVDSRLLLHFSRQQKGDMIGRCIPIAKETWRNSYSVLELLQYNAQLDAASKEWLWKQLIDCGNEHEGYGLLDDLNLEQKPFDYHISDELLAGCLNNKNERLRAMGQHIWQKLGKPLDEQTLNRWAEDSDLMVRANVVFLRTDKIPASESSLFIRLIQNLAE